MNAYRLPLPPRSAAVLAACALLVLAFAPAQYFGRQQDDVYYVVAARALTSGRYCLLTTPGCPAITVVNPGWPLLLLPIAFFTERPALFQAFSALLLACVPAALWAWLRRRRDDTTALLAAALFASSPLALSQSGVVMSEIPFLLVTIALIAAAEAGRAADAGLWAAALLSLRTAGLSALPGAFAPFARARSTRGLAAVAAPPAAVGALWAGWCLAKSGTVAKFALLPATYAGRSWLKPLQVAAVNARWYAGEWGACFLPPSRANGRVALLIGTCLACAAAAGLARAWRRRPDDPAAWTLAGGILLHLFWGWQYERYLLVLLPLLIWACAEGLGRAAKPVLGTLLTLQLGAQTLPRLLRPSPWARPELARTYDWLSSRPRPALLASVEHVRDGYWSGLPNVALPIAPDAASFAAALKSRRATYVLRVVGLDYGLEQDPGSDIRRGAERAQSYLDDAALFRKIHEEPAESAAVYELR